MSTPLLWSICLLLLTAGARAEKLPAFALEKARNVSALVTSQAKNAFKTPTLEMRYSLLSYYLGRLKEDDNAFPVQDVRKFAVATRSLTLRAQPPQSVLDSWKELDLCLTELAEAKGLVYESLPASSYQAVPDIPTDLAVRREELVFGLYNLRKTVAALKDKARSSPAPLQPRALTDLDTLDYAAGDMERALRAGQLSEQHFSNFQVARARWEISRAGLPLLLRQSGIEVSQYNQTCSELWRAGQ